MSDSGMQIKEHKILDLGIPASKLKEGDTFYGQLCWNIGADAPNRWVTGSNRLLCLITDSCVVVLNGKGQTHPFDLLTIKDYVPVRILCEVEELEAKPDKRKKRKGRGAQLEL